MANIIDYKRNGATIFEKSDDELSAMRLQWECIVQAVSVAFEIDVESIVGRRRHREVVDARHAACYIAYKRHGWSMSTIGKFLGRDHTTVMNALRVTEILLESLPIFETRYGTAIALLDADAHSKEAALLKAKDGVARLRKLMDELEGVISMARSTIEHLAVIVEKYSSSIQDYDHEQNPSVSASPHGTDRALPPERIVSAVPRF